MNTTLYLSDHGTVLSQLKPPKELYQNYIYQLKMSTLVQKAPLQIFSVKNKFKIKLIYGTGQ
jgi:hypothetical protein